MASDREISEIVRTEILRILWDRGDATKQLACSELSAPEYYPFFEGSARWLESEGLIRLGRPHPGVSRVAKFSEASLTSRGERFLRHTPKSKLKPVGDLISEAFRDVSKEGLKRAIIEAPAILWATYETWKSTQG